ncbi:Photosystem I chlorophyll a apoprotein A1 [Capsicum annuum]|nr:Photosystem I chlorophyll a apoprotein A1 [Capsicum annuum]
MCCPERGGLNDYSLPESEVKILVDRDPVKTFFEEWARPGHFSRTIAKGSDTITWIWNLHVNAHDFDSHTSDLVEISRKVFSAHFGQLSIFFLWLSGMYFHAIGALVFAALMILAGWFHSHKAAPKLAWFQVGGKVALLPIPLGTVNFLVHHIHAFTIHVTVLILLKGILFAHSSRLISDKSDVWGSVSDQGVVTHITKGNLAQSSITINGWLCDFLWAQAPSGYGYWQKLIESIVWAHNKLKVVPTTQPRALSIIQGRALGVTHYLLGGIATTWAFFLARIIAGG